MGMMVSSGNLSVRSITLRGSNGSAVGTISMTNSAKKKPKKLKYNFKEISVQILSAKTSGNARKVAGKARNKVALLRQKIKNDDYDSKELESAIAHALKMEKIAKKKMKHLQQEERVKQMGAGDFLELPQTEEETDLEGLDQQKDFTQKEDELKQLMQEYEQLMEEVMKQSNELLSGDMLMDELTENAPEDMQPEDLDLLKKKHRAKEQKEIAEADLQYLKAMFERLAKEKQEIGNNSMQNSNSSSGVLLELAGQEIPVQTAEVPVMAESSLDITI